MKTNKEKMHEILDGAQTKDYELSAHEVKELNSYKEVARELESSSVAAPAGITQRIMSAIPSSASDTLKRRIYAILPQETTWFTPALACAAAIIILLTAVIIMQPGGSEHLLVTFNLNAPQAESVQILGSFNNWQRGTMVLEKPDSSQTWTITLKLPKGQHEYVFLVDNKEWISDPSAVVSRPDGFGKKNSIIQI